MRSGPSEQCDYISDRAKMYAEIAETKVLIKNYEVELTMKTTKIYDNEKEVYSGNCYVNTVIFRGRIYDEFKKVGQNGIRFSLQLSNGKDPKTGKWNKPTFADCTAFGAVAKRILNEYKPKDEIWLIAKYYSKQQDGKYYKGFIVREIITEKEIQQANKSVFDDLPF